MNDKPVGPTADLPISQDLYLLARYWFSQRRTWMIVTAIALTLGAYFNWQLLVVAGIAPLLWAVAPCLAMCVLGLCMHGGKTYDKPSVAEDVAADAAESPKAGR